MNIAEKLLESQEEEYRDKISTVDKTGKRIWLYPKQPKGIFFNYRRIVGYSLVLFLIGMPFIKYNGEPLFLLNIVESKFILFGTHFLPQDFHIFVLAMLITILMVVLFTAIFGRLFCGWVCPQTVFMELVYRPIEYLIEGSASAQRKLNKRPWDGEKTIKKVAKHALFILVAIIISHTFLSYIIGVDELFKIVTEPIGSHLGGFIAMVIFTIVFYGVFAFMREQVCTTICPYGRLQGVLLDDNSLNVAYDFVRGEPRGKIKKQAPKPKKEKKEPCKRTCAACKAGAPSCHTEEILEKINAVEPPKLGDCIDCKLCVQVCPTGIDIRNGTQMECVNCTACMDVCDEVMIKVNRPTKLIRIDSYNGIINKKASIWSPRVLAYSGVLLILLVLESFMFYSRSDVETLLLRTQGMPYYETEDGKISNLYNYQLINKTDKELVIEFVSSDLEGKVEFEVIGGEIKTVSHELTEGAIFIKIPRDMIEDRKTELSIDVLGNGELLETIETTFFGPTK